MKKLELYHKLTCPHSAKVRRFIEINRVEDRIRFHDVEVEGGARQRLESLTGNQEVPCLVIDGVPLQESGAIVRWLDFHLVKPQRTAA